MTVSSMQGTNTKHWGTKNWEIRQPRGQNKSPVNDTKKKNKTPEIYELPEKEFEIIILRLMSYKRTQTIA